MSEKKIQYNHKPPMYDSPEEMSAKIDEYFNNKAYPDGDIESK